MVLTDENSQEKRYIVNSIAKAYEVMDAAIQMALFSDGRTRFPQRLTLFLVDIGIPHLIVCILARMELKDQSLKAELLGN